MKFSGSTDPRAAIYKALELKPEVVYVLTDGEFDGDMVDAISRK